MATVGTASLTAAVVAILMMVMAALNVGIELQFSRQQRLHRRIRIAGNTAVQLNPSLSQRRLCTAPNTAADQRIHAINLQKSGQCSMPASVGLQKQFADHRPIFHFIQFKPLRVTKMLKNLPILIGNRNFHGNSFPQNALF